VILVCLTALTVWWRGAGHTESIAPFIDYGMLAGASSSGLSPTGSRRQRTDPASSIKTPDATAFGPREVDERQLLLPV